MTLMLLISLWSFSVFFFFLNDTAPTEIYTLSLHDALPIFTASAGSRTKSRSRRSQSARSMAAPGRSPAVVTEDPRSEEHTSELQSRLHLVCRLLLEKKNNKVKNITYIVPNSDLGVCNIVNV